MVAAHKSSIYDDCEIENNYPCVDGIHRDALIMPGHLFLDHDSTHDSHHQLHDYFAEMRYCLFWYSQIKFPHQPNVNVAQWRFEHHKIWFKDGDDPAQKAKDYVRSHSL